MDRGGRVFERQVTRLHWPGKSEIGQTRIYQTQTTESYHLLSYETDH